MKKMKIFLSFMSVFLFFIALVLILNHSNVDANENIVKDSTNLNDLVSKYYNNGTYTKKTQIHLKESSEFEIATYFHGSVQEDRTTYYTKDSGRDALFMSDFDGTINHINSGYATVTQENIEEVQTKFPKAQLGHMVHFTYVNNAPSYDYYVTAEKNENKTLLTFGIQQFYVTLDDMMVNGYFNSWTSNQYDVTNKDDKFLLDFLAFAAPCLEDTILNNEYISAEYMTLSIEEIIDSVNSISYLSLKMFVDSTNGGIVDNVNCLLAEARIYSGNIQFDESELETITISFESNGGTEYLPIISNGMPITLPTPVQKGYEFVGWYLSSDYSGEALGDSFSSVVDCVLYAKWNKLPPAEHIKQDENGNLVTTGAVVKVLEDNGNNEGRFSIDVSVVKTAATGGVGSAEVAFRIIHSGIDYGYQQAGMYYLMAGVSPGGYIDIHKVTNGAWSRFKRFELNQSPSVWQEKYNSAAVGDKITVKMTVCDYGDSFEIYLDDVLLYTCTDSALLAQYTGTGFGLRSNTNTGSNTKTSAVFSNWEYQPFTTISFDTNGGSAVEEIRYGYGSLKVENPIKDKCVFDGWYYDSELTKAVDLSKPEISGNNITLYAKWKVAEAVITLMSEGMIYDEINYSKDSSLTLPTITPVAPNRIFTGWYYDNEYTRAVDVNNLQLEGTELTIYAGFRYPTTSALTDNGDGTYSLSKTAGVAVLGEVDSVGVRYDMNLTYPKSANGATGIAFRMAVRADNTYNNSQYIGVTLYGSGIMQVGTCPGDNSVYHLTGIISNGAQQKSTIALSKLPTSWQTKYAGIQTGEIINVTLTILDYGYTFEIYIDGDFAFRYIDLEGTNDDISNFTGNGYGLRHTNAEVDFTMSAQEMTVVSFETNGGSKVESVLYDIGALNVENPTRNNYVFAGWYYDSELTQVVDLTKLEILGTNVTLYAKWKMISPAERIKQDEDGNLVTTGSVVKVLEDNGNNEGRFSIDVSVIKTAKTSGVGSAEVAFRIIHTGVDNGVQNTGMYYLMAGVSPGGYIEIHRVTDGKWARIKRFELAQSPSVWQEKYNNAAVGDKITVKMTVCDYGDSFEIYLDDVLLYTCTDVKLLAQYTGTGFGLRSNTAAGTVYSNWEYKPFITISFDTNGGSEVESINYGYGSLKIENPSKENYVFDGWYYDETFTQKVDIAEPQISGSKVTLYAKWK